MTSAPPGARHCVCPGAHSVGTTREVIADHVDVESQSLEYRGARRRWRRATPRTRSMSEAVNSIVGGTGTVPVTSSGAASHSSSGQLSRSTWTKRAQARSANWGSTPRSNRLDPSVRKRVAFRTSRDAHGVEVGRLEKYVGRRVTDLTGGAAHDARESEHVVVAVDDDAVFAGVTESSPGGRRVRARRRRGSRAFRRDRARRARRVRLGDVGARRRRASAVRVRA